MRATAALALPPSGGAEVCTLTPSPYRPATRSRLAPGTTFTCSVTQSIVRPGIHTTCCVQCRQATCITKNFIPIRNACRIRARDAFGAVPRRGSPRPAVASDTGGENFVRQVIQRVTRDGLVFLRAEDQADRRVFAGGGPGVGRGGPGKGGLGGPGGVGRGG